MARTRYSRLGRNSSLLVIMFTLLFCCASVSTPSLKTLGPGADAPEFNLTDGDLQKHTFKTLLGEKLTIIVFWATWSRKSEEALTNMQQLYSNQAERGLAVVGINVDKQKMSREELQQKQATFSNLGLSYPNLVDRNLETFHAYGVVAVPTIVVIDKDAMIVFEMSGYPHVKAGELKTYVKDYLGDKKSVEKTQTYAGYEPTKKAVRFYNLGLKAQQSARTAKSSENNFKKAIEDDPGFIQPYIALARLYRREGKAYEARTLLQKALSIDSTSAPALFESGLVEEGSENLEAAASLMRQAIEADDYFTPAYYLLGYLTGKKGELKSAESLFTKAEGQNPMDYRLYRYRGQMYEALGDTGSAMASYRHGLELLLEMP